MVQLPKKLRGLEVIDDALFATDTSMKPYFGMLMLDHGDGIRTITDVFSTDGVTWDAENGLHRITKERAAIAFPARRKARERFTPMILKRECSWLALAMMRWDHMPVSGWDEFGIYARAAAGMARDFDEFYAVENRSVAQAIEQWLTRYSAAHTHPDLRA